MLGSGGTLVCVNICLVQLTFFPAHAFRSKPQIITGKKSHSEQVKDTLTEYEVRLAEDGETVLLNDDPCTVTNEIDSLHAVVTCGSRNAFVKPVEADEADEHRKMQNRCPDIAQFYGYGPCPKAAMLFDFAGCLYVEYIEDGSSWREEKMSISSMSSLAVALLRAQSCLFKYTGHYHNDLHFDNVLRRDGSWLVIDMDPSFEAGSNAVVATSNPAGCQAFKIGICQMLGMHLRPMPGVRTCENQPSMGDTSGTMASLRTIFCGRCTPHGRVFDYTVSPCEGGPFLSLDEAVDHLATKVCPAHWEVVRSESKVCPPNQQNDTDAQANRVTEIFAQCIEEEKYDDDDSEFESESVSESDGSDGASLPAGWRQTMDPSSGRPYFWKEADPSGSVTWVRPLQDED